MNTKSELEWLRQNVNWRMSDLDLITKSLEHSLNYVQRVIRDLEHIERQLDIQINSYEESDK